MRARTGKGTLVAGVVLVLAWLLAGQVGATPQGQDFVGRVVRVVDGDTLSVEAGGQTWRIRLEGVDCPERSQPWSRKATLLVSQRASGRVVRVQVKTTDRYQRLVARVLVGGEDLSLELLRAGLAWHFKRYNQEPQLADLETQARAARRGLWSDPDPVPPWEWRHAHPR